MSMTLRLPLLFFMLINSLSAGVPTLNETRSWLSQEDISISDIQTLYLQDNERAYLARIRFEGKEPAHKGSLALLRPELDEAEFIPDFAQEFSIDDLDHDGVSEIIAVSTSTEGSYRITSRTILQFHDYRIKEIYRDEAKEQLHCNVCAKEELTWDFDDINKDKIRDLIVGHRLLVTTPSTNHIVFEEKLEIPFVNGSFLHRRPPLRLDALIFGEDVKERVVIKPNDRFPLNTKKVACFLDFTRVDRDASITYDWWHESKGEILKSSQTIHPAERYRTWLFKQIDNNREYLGNWGVLILDRYHRLLGAKEFRVVPNPSAQKQASLPAGTEEVSNPAETGSL